MGDHLAAVLSRGIERLAQGQTIEQYMGHVDARNPVSYTHLTLPTN